MTLAAAFGVELLAPRGLLVSFGNASGKPDSLDPLLLSAKGSLFLTRPTLADYVRTRADLLSSANALFEMIAHGALRIQIGHRFPLAAAADAHRALEARTTTGSTLLTV